MLRTIPARLRFVTDPAEPTGGAPTDPPADPPADPAPAAPADDPAAELEKWKALARKHEARAKENADKAKRLDEIEEANKTELQKITERAEKAERAAAEAAAKSLRLEIAATKGVPADLLTADTAEALEAQAAALLAFKGTVPTAPPATGQGAQGTPVGAGEKQLTREDLKGMSPDQITEAKAKGQLDTLLGIKRQS